MSTTATGPVLSNLFDPDLLARMVDEGFVRVAHHPTLPLSIYGYSEKAQYQGEWNEVTTRCRGLIADDDGNIVARPFGKFWNLAEKKLPGWCWYSAPTVTRKMDGSLAVITRYEGELLVTTRGSFVSEQAQWATNWFAANHPGWRPPEGITFLGEILYPANQIVLASHAARNEVVLLAVIENDTGADYPIHAVNADWWPGQIVDTVYGEGSIGQVAQAVADDRWANEEGVVAVWYQDDGPSHRAKIKHERYVTLHRLITGTSNRAIWEALSRGDDPLEIAGQVPDEFHKFLRDTTVDLLIQHAAVSTQALGQFAMLAHLRDDRKAFAAEAVKSENKGLLFALLDGKDIEPMIWHLIRPEYVRPYTNSDVA